MFFTLPLEIYEGHVQFAIFIYPKLMQYIYYSSGLIWFWTGLIAFLNQYNFSYTGTSCLKLVQSDIWL